MKFLYLVIFVYAALLLTVFIFGHGAFKECNCNCECVPLNLKSDAIYANPQGKTCVKHALQTILQNLVTMSNTSIAKSLISNSQQFQQCFIASVASWCKIIYVCVYNKIMCLKTERHVTIFRSFKALRLKENIFSCADCKKWGSEFHI